jgi:ankyrin repeat protein
VEIVELLLIQGTCVNARNCNTSTPLLLAAKEGSEEIVKLLLKHGADVNSSYTSTSWEVYTPLCLAVKEGHGKSY